MTTTAEGTASDASIVTTGQPTTTDSALWSTHDTSQTTTSSSSSMTEATSTANSTTSFASSSTDTTETTEPNPTFPPLPSRKDNALDLDTADGAFATTCPTLLDYDALCYTTVPCGDESCTASFEWMNAGVTWDGLSQNLSLMDLSGDGTVLVGHWETPNAAANRRAFVLRWGKAELTLLAPEYESFGVAINFDATAAAGSVQPCVNQTCDYAGVRYEASGLQFTPEELTSPYDMSDGITLIGYERPDTILLSTLWSTGEPTVVSNVALSSLSGDGQYAAGTTDGTGELVLYYGNGTKPIPASGSFRADFASILNYDGSVVVGWGWDSANLVNPMFRWETQRNNVDPGTIAVYPPLAGFDEAVPFGVTSDGAFISGVHRRDWPSTDPADAEAFYWNASAGIRPLRDLLAERGLTLPSTVHLHDPRVSADGSTLVGRGYNQNGPILWRARLAQ